MKQFLDDFKKFALKGNVLDLAVGVIIGGAFGKIVSSLVNNLIMPLLGLVLGGVNLSNLSVQLAPAMGDRPANVLEYGLFLQSVLDFLIIALSIFLFIRLLGKLQRKKEPPAPQTPAKPSETELLTEIRDLLKSKK